MQSTSLNDVGLMYRLGDSVEIDARNRCDKKMGPPNEMHLWFAKMLRIAKIIGPA